jgi:sec-independent protein translocase protein TatA
MSLLGAIPVTIATFSPMDMGIIFFVILIFFGAKKLPEFARSMGQAVREFSRAKDDFEREITRPSDTVQPHALEHSSDPYHERVEPEHTSETVPASEDDIVTNHPAKPEGIQPYTSAGDGTAVDQEPVRKEQNAPAGELKS